MKCQDRSGNGAAFDTGSDEGAKLKVSMGHTVTQIPHPMQLDVELSSTSCLSAYCMTSIPTWQ